MVFSILDVQLPVVFTVAFTCLLFRKQAMPQFTRSTERLPITPLKQQNSGLPGFRCGPHGEGRENPLQNTRQFCSAVSAPIRQAAAPPAVLFPWV